MKSYIIKYKNSGFESSVELPGSKSISNRLLIMKALSGSNIHFKNLSESDDTRLLKRLLKIIRVCAKSDIPTVIYTENAGTVMRFLTAYLSQKEGKWLITGNKRMQNRPLKALVNALTGLGADIKYIDKEGFPPLLIREKQTLKGGTVVIDASISSQFVSALMLIAPYLDSPLNIVFKEKPVSFSYIKMTAELMKKAGVEVLCSGSEVAVPSGNYTLDETGVEKDWSSAAFWYQMTAIAKKGKIFMPGLNKNSLQGDKILATLFEKLGVSTTFEKDGVLIKYSGNEVKELEYDFSGCPDIVPAVMATCAAKGIKALFKGIEHLRHKESDRIEKMNMELKKAGAVITKQNSGYVLLPTKTTSQNPVFDTHGDHRLAMSLAPLAQMFDSVTVNNPGVVSKSYPQYWKQLLKTGAFRIEEAEQQ